MAATPTFVKDKTTLVMKLEPESGTAETLAAGDNDIKFFDVTVSPEIESYVQEFASGRHSKGPAVMGKRKVTFTAKAALLTADDVEDPPKIGKAFQACGQAWTEPDDTQTYMPDPEKDSGNDVTATIWAVFWPSSGTGGVAVKAKGCMGNCVIAMDSLGAPLVAQFTFTGALIGIFDQTAIPMAEILDTGYAPGTVSSVIKVGGENQQVSKFSLDFGNTIELDPDPGDADGTGYAAAYIAKRNPKLMLNVKLKTLSGNDHYERWSLGTQAVFQLTTALNDHDLKYSIIAPKTQLLTMPMGSREGSEMMMWDQTYELHEDEGGDEFSIVMQGPPPPPEP